ncbi:MAG: O-antigen ligase family protein [Terracidiphilus sp.]
MRALARWLLLGLAFSIPWEYSLDLGSPLGNVARIMGLALLLVMAPAVLQAGRMRRLHPLHWLVLALLAWSAVSYFWSVDSQATLAQVRGYVQETMIAWFVWELIDSPDQMRDLLRCYVAGSWVLAGLTIANFISPDAAGQIRFVAQGQDPNDVARFLDLGFPLGALLVNGHTRWGDKLLVLGYMPLGLLGVLLTASRSGLIAAVIALAGCGLMLARNRSRTVIAIALPAVLLAFWVAVPQGTTDRILSTPQALAGGDLNQRLSIWAAGWEAFARAPLVGTGAGTFLSATHLPLGVTAHNTALAIAVEGGVVALLAAAAVLALAAASVLAMQGIMRMGLGTALLVWLVNALVLSIQTNRATWLLLGTIVVAGRLAAEQPGELARVFPQPGAASEPAPLAVAAE